MKTTLQDPIIKWVCTMLPQPPQIYVFLQIIFSKKEPKKQKTYGRATPWSLLSLGIVPEEIGLRGVLMDSLGPRGTIPFTSSVPLSLEIMLIYSKRVSL